MIDAVVFSRLLICRQIPRCLHYHNGLLVPVGIAADRTYLLICERAAHLAVSDILSGVHDSPGQLFHLIHRHIDHVKRQSLRRLVPDPGQAGKLLDQPADLITVIIHF